MFSRVRVPHVSYDVQSFLNVVAFFGMALWFVCSVLFTVVPYPNRFLLYQFPLGCAPVDCRNGSLSAGHTVVWLVVMGFGLIAGFYVKRGWPAWRSTVTDGMLSLEFGGRWPVALRSDDFFNSHFWFVGAVLAFMFGCYHEFLWNAIATVAYGETFVQFLSSSNGITGYVTFDALATFVILRSKAGQYIDKKRLAFASMFWVVFMVLWLSIGFQVTYFNGPTVWYSNSFVNFIETNSFLIMFTGAVGVLKGGSF